MDIKGFYDKKYGRYTIFPAFFIIYECAYPD